MDWLTVVLVWITSVFGGAGGNGFSIERADCRNTPLTAGERRVCDVGSDEISVGLTDCEGPPLSATEQRLCDER